MSKTAWLVWRRGEAGLADWKHLGWAGWSAATVSSAATICFIAAFRKTAVANEAIIYATAPFAAAAIAWVWMRETLGLATLAAVRAQPRRRHRHGGRLGGQSGSER